MHETAAIDSAPRDLHQLAQFSSKYPAWTVPSLRFHVFHAKQNGMADQGVIWRIGKRILISESAFFRWIAEQQMRNRSTAQQVRADRPAPKVHKGGAKPRRPKGIGARTAPAKGGA